MKKIKALLLSFAVLLTLTSFLNTAQAKPLQYQGVKINIVTQTGPQIAEPLTRHAAEFKAKTGAEINVVSLPFADLYQAILTDQTTKTNSYQAFVFAPQWMVDYAGFLEDLTPRIAASKDIQWDDVGAFFRDFSSSYGGKTLTIPVDGDFHMMYYRLDVFKKAGLSAPKTWDDYLAAAKAINGMDMGDGPIYGSCIAKKRSAQAYWFVSSIAGGYIQAKGTSEGGFFDTTTFKPLINNEAFIAALDVLKATNQFGPPNEQAADVGDTRSLFTAGKCGMTLDWGDIGSLSVAPESKVKDKVGSLILPGSTKVLDRATGKLVACDKDRCPYAIDGVNHAPFAAFGGWSGAISAGADPKVKDAAFDFFAYVTAPAQSGVDVTIGKTGFNPYRKSHFASLDNWIKGGFSEAAAKDYLGAISASLNSPNMMLDLRVPQNQRYQQVVQDAIVSQFLAGELKSDEAAKQISDKWEEITEELGRDKQLAAYRSTLGIKGGN
jgi:multiple sugar transport system substrate-binding protein